MSNSYFQWDKDFLTGFDTIDSQHYNLVKLINKLISLSLKGENVCIEEVELIRNELIDYTETHFKTEESIMENHSIDMRHKDMHFKLHREFVSSIKSYFSDLSKLSNSDELGKSVEYLVRWLAYHILNVDKSLSRQLERISEFDYSPLDAYELEEKFTESSTEPLLKALKALYFLVAEKNKELEQKNSELELNVKERTAELVEANRMLEKLSTIDELTGLPNRRFIVSKIGHMIEIWERYRESFSVVFIDLDKFKVVNDTLGHEYGDRVLRTVADFLKNSVRKSDSVCRLGGDEFVIVCEKCDSEGVHRVIKNLKGSCSEDAFKDIIEFWKPSMSVGVYTIDGETSRVEDILKKADSAMYKSKKLGGGTIVI